MCVYPSLHRELLDLVSVWDTWRESQKQIQLPMDSQVPQKAPQFCISKVPTVIMPPFSNLLPHNLPTMRSKWPPWNPLTCKLMSSLGPSHQLFLLLISPTICTKRDTSLLLYSCLYLSVSQSLYHHLHAVCPEQAVLSVPPHRQVSSRKAGLLLTCSLLCAPCPAQARPMQVLIGYLWTTFVHMGCHSSCLAQFN